jgi:hypothetical protein
MPPCGYYPRSQYPRAVITALTTALKCIDPAGGRGFVPETPAKADADIEIREAKTMARARFFINSPEAQRCALKSVFPTRASSQRKLSMQDLAK